jgi:hypothetical protein
MINPQLFLQVLRVFQPICPAATSSLSALNAPWGCQLTSLKHSGDNPISSIEHSKYDGFCLRRLWHFSLAILHGRLPQYDLHWVDARRMAIPFSWYRRPS